MKLRAKIFLYFGSFTIAAIAAIFLLNHLLIEHYLHDTAKTHLQKTVDNMHQATETLLNTAIENYLRGVTDRNLDLIEQYYAAWQRGELSEQEAKDAVQRHVDAQRIGESGYVVAVGERNATLYLDIHPYLRGTDCAATEGCQQWHNQRSGYLTYPWQNPEDQSFRTKVAYLTEFKPWNWILGATSYKSEFIDLIKISDLKKLLAQTKILQQGYFFVFDENRKVLIHPEIEGYIEEEPGVMTDLMKRAGGHMTYSWKNPSEDQEYEKFAYIRYLEDFKLYLVGTGYQAEIHAPVEMLKFYTVLAVGIVGTILSCLIIFFSRSLEKPLRDILKGITRYYQSKTPYQMRTKTVHEVQLLGKALSKMTLELNQSRQNTEHVNALLDNILNSMPSLLVAVDRNLQIIQWNKEAQKRSAVSLHKNTVNTLSDAFPDLAKWWEELGIDIAEKKVMTSPIQHREKDGQIFHEVLTVYPLVTNGVEGAVIRIDDVTRRIELEEALQQSRKMDAVGQLAGGIAHDFNNMLAGILSAAQILERRIDAEDSSQKMVKIIRESASRSAELTNKLLTFSRKQATISTPISVHFAVTEAISLLTQTIDKKITISSELTAPHDVVVGDPIQLQNLFMNLGINAAHAMVDGGELRFVSEMIELSPEDCAKSKFELQPGTYLKVEVTDTGCGIAPEHLEKIFEPFFTTKRSGEGTGLGLSLVYGIVEQHKGMIEVESRQMRGTCFRLYFPLCQESPQELQTTYSPQVKGEGTILVIEDEEVLRITAKTLLQDSGFKVLVADNGSTGVKTYQDMQDQIDLVLMDMIMPEMDGRNCFEQLKELNPEIKVVITSGFCKKEDIKSLFDQGLVDFLTKPYRADELLTAVKNALTD